MSRKDFRTKVEGGCVRLFDLIQPDTLESVYRPRDYRAILAYVEQAESEWPTLPDPPADPEPSTTSVIMSADRPNATGADSPPPNARPPAAPKTPRKSPASDGAASPSTERERCDDATRQIRRVIRYGRL